mgnify:CR=1 FL=1
MKITFHGHSCFLIESNQTRILIDPFLSGNPTAILQPDQVNVDVILLTHAHNDHLGDTVEIAKRNKAQVIASHELANWLSWQGVEAHGMSIGGKYSTNFGQVQMTPAFHGNGYIDEEKKEIIYMGMPAGFVIQVDGKNLYHAGDTSLFSDMQLIKRKYEIDLAFLPIGDNFTMGPDDAVLAAEWVGAKQVIPMHYNTFPLIEQDPHAFVERLAEKNIQGIVLEVGKSINL